MNDKIQEEQNSKLNYKQEIKNQTDQTQIKSLYAFQ